MPIDEKKQNFYDGETLNDQSELYWHPIIWLGLLAHLHMNDSDCDYERLSPTDYPLPDNISWPLMSNEDLHYPRDEKKYFVLITREGSQIINMKTHITRIHLKLENSFRELLQSKINRNTTNSCLQQKTN
jgi:hypothetical protein